MTFAPTKKTSKSRTKKRTTNWIRLTAKKILNKTSLQYDEDGKALWLRHFVSPVTGKYYMWKKWARQVLDVNKKMKKRKEKISKIHV